MTLATLNLFLFIVLGAALIVATLIFVGIVFVFVVTEDRLGKE